jgi:hypothetical protein
MIAARFFPAPARARENQSGALEFPGLFCGKNPGDWWKSWRLRLGLVALAAACRLPAQITENPLTVAPGHFLVKTDVVSFYFQDQASLQEGTRYPVMDAGDTFITTGLTGHIDLELGLEPFLRSRLATSGGTITSSGIGDVYLRSKWNFWSDSGLQAQAAVMPFVKLPTNSGGVGNGSVEGGIIVPWSMALDHGYRTTAMAEWTAVRNDANDGYDSRWFASLALQEDLNPSVGLYAEATLGLTSAGVARTAFAAGGGITVEASSRVQLDLAFYAGLSGGAATWNPVLRLRWHF